MYDDDDNSTGPGKEKYTKEQFQKMMREQYAEEARQNAMRDAEKAREIARNRKAENEEFKDKRQQKSDLIRQAELAKMKEILNMPKGGGGGGSGGAGGVKSMKYEPVKYAKGGKVSSASKRADGCAVRGKTKGKMV